MERGGGYMSVQSFHRCDEAVRHVIDTLASYEELSPAEHIYVLIQVFREVIKSDDETKPDYGKRGDT
jgi:hypothetical protein